MLHRVIWINAASRKVFLSRCRWFWMSGAKSPIAYTEFTLHRFDNRLIFRWFRYACSTPHDRFDVLRVDLAVSTSESILSNLLKFFIIYLSSWLCSYSGVGFHLLPYHALVHFYYFQNFSRQLMMFMGCCWQWQFFWSSCINNTNFAFIFFNASL